jgi:hypothetical protein
MCVVVNHSTRMQRAISAVPKIVIIIVKLRYFHNFIFVQFISI